ncbi:MAG: PAS domain S-box protein [Desulfobacterium sp.]|nr:PAS domain S-box protein [Desulfobacterium sp.]
MIDYIVLIKGLADNLAVMRGLGDNLAVILSLLLLYHIVYPSLRRLSQAMRHLALGFLFGGMALIGMALCVEIEPGVILDSRLVLVPMAGLCGGFLAAIPAVFITCLYRIWLGGAGTLAGVGAVLTGAAIGVAVYYGFKKKLDEIRYYHILAFAILVTLNALAWIPALPIDHWGSSFYTIVIIVSIFFPFSSMLLSGFILTEKKRVLGDLILREGEENYWSLMEKMPDLLYKTDLNGNILFVSKATLPLFGYRQEEGIGMKTADFYVNPEDRERFIAELKRKGKITDFQTRLRHRNGSIWWSSTNARLFKNSQGKILGIEGIIRNITQRKYQDGLTAAQLRLVDYTAGHTVPQLLQKIIDEAEALTHSKVGFFHFLDQDQSVISRQGWSTNTRRLCKSDIVQPHFPISDQDIWTECIKGCRPVIRNNYPQSIPESVLPNGHPPLARFLIIPIIRNGKVEALLGLGNKSFDYDEMDMDTVGQLARFAWETVVRKRAEEALVERETLLRAVFDQTYQLMALFSTDGKFIAVNRASTEFAEVDESFLIGKTMWETLWWKDSPEKRDRAINTFSKSVAGEFLRFETANLTKNGAPRTIDTSLRPIFNDEGEVIFICAEGRDITDKKAAEKENAKLEAQLLQAHKLEAIGTLAGGVAHDFNNILAGIIGLAELAQEDVGKADPLKYYIDQIALSGYRAKDLVEQILLFSQQKDQDMQSVDLKVMAKEVVRLLRSTVPRTIEIKTRFLPEKAMVMSSPAQIHQILMNLCSNAVHAMTPRGGDLLISMEEATLNRNDLSTLPGLTPGAFLILKVCDSGHGIPPDILDKVFDPFFSTKVRGEGTGLGLAVVHGIVTKHGGEIRVESMPGRGTVVSIYLPRAKDEVAQNLPMDMDINGGNEHILLVDDEPLIIESISRMLKRLGYRVTGVLDSREAWDLFSENPDRFDLVVTDNQMPHMGGISLSEKMFALNPHTHIILCTGFGDRLTIRLARQIGIKAIVYKPVIKAKIAAEIRWILDTPESKGK